MNTTVRVHLLGRDYLLRSQGDSTQVQAAAALVEKKLSELPDAISVDTRDRFMLALMNLAGEYLQAQGDNEVLTIELQKVKDEQTAEQAQSALTVQRLVDRIEEALDA